MAKAKANIKHTVTKTHVGAAKNKRIISNKTGIIFALHI